MAEGWGTVKDVVVDDSNITIVRRIGFGGGPDGFVYRLLDAQTFILNYVNDPILYTTAIDNHGRTIMYGRIFKFLNAGITFNFWSINQDHSLDVDGLNMLRIDIDTGPLKYNITYDMGNDLEYYHYNYLLQNITRIYETQTRRVGRNLVSVQRVGMNRGLPENVEGHTASFLTGINRTGRAGQQNKLKQTLGISLAPRARKTRKHRR